MLAIKSKTRVNTKGVALALASSLTASGQTDGPLGYSVATPHPISPAEGTTTPNAQATQRQNPYSQLRPDQNNRASSLTNLFRNWDGSFGMFITTAAERREVTALTTTESNMKGK